jgi:predicted protein tyrosine phosphatase
MLRQMSFDVFVSALAQGRLAADAPRVRPTHVLSLLDPDCGKVELAALGIEARYLIVRFHDSLVPNKPDSFDNAHLRMILGFVNVAITSAEREPVRLLVHCHHGQSRSPAIAFVALALALGQGREKEAFENVRRSTPGFWPNKLMVQAADAALGRGGALVRQLDEFQTRFRPPSAPRQL